MVKLFGVIVALIAAVVTLWPNSAQASTTPAAPARVLSCSYTVKFGDTLSHIAPDNWRQIAVPSGNPDFIFPGQVLDLCPSSIAPAPTNTQPVSQVKSKGPNLYPYGWCTWAAEELAVEDLNGLGNAPDWTWAAAARGIPTGYVARAGATAVFQPGYHTAVWGTSSGHVAHVNAVSGNMMQITEMNNSYYGGWGIWDTVWIPIASGVSFIY